MGNLNANFFSLERLIPKTQTYDTPLLVEGTCNRTKHVIYYMYLYSDSLSTIYAVPYINPFKNV